MLSTDEIKHIALLSRIGVDEKEIKKYQKDLSAVLDYFKKLEEVDTKNIQEIGHITGRSNYFRKDEHELREEKITEEIMKNVPEAKDGFIRVKSVL
jgi:aspartyl-tRNA(Asn)/glutamyl-tRNA(Gln) amidotransferase subunit C